MELLKDYLKQIGLVPQFELGEKYKHQFRVVETVMKVPEDDFLYVSKKIEYFSKGVDWLVATKMVMSGIGAMDVDVAQFTYHGNQLFTDLALEILIKNTESVL